VRGRRLAGPVLVALALGAACGTDDASTAVTGEPAAAPSTTSSTATSTTTAAPAPVEGLLAEVATNRLYAPRRELGLALRNTTGAPIPVSGFQLVSPRFEPVEPTTRSVVLPPGRRLVIPLPYGPARCDGASGGYAASVVLADGRRVEVPAPQERPGDVDRVHERECAAAEARQLVDLRFEGDWAREGVAIAGELVVERRAPGPPVVVDDVTGNVIFTLLLGADDRPVLRLGPDDDVASVPVTIRADRCDSHAVAEFKRPFTFLSWIGVGDGEPTPVELDVTGPARDAMAALLASC